ncbi:MAG: hypothetical protein ACMXYL_03850 [Candidatus Woesearchaeota archaeon]
MTKQKSDEPVKDPPAKVAARFQNELSDIKDLLQSAKDDGSFEDSKEKIYDGLLDIAKRMLREILEFPASMTYEEIETIISEHKELDEEGKTHARIISSLLNDAEFSPNPEYDRLDSIIEGMTSFAEWSKNYRPGLAQKKKRKGIGFFRGILLFLKAATFIFWFPFYWFFASLKRHSQKKRISDDPSYPIVKEIARANKMYKRKDMKRAIESYDKIKELYNTSPTEIKAMTRPEILALHEKIMSDYKSMAKKKSDNK